MTNRDELLKSLLCSATYPHKVRIPITHLETHISDVFLTGDFAYKIKKPVKFDFCDFTSLKKRKEFCGREVALNSRFAPEIYLGVVPITFNGASFEIEGMGEGEVVEYAVKMKQFESGALFSRLLPQGRVSQNELIELADRVCSFYQSAERKNAFWGYASVRKIILDNVEVFKRSVPQLFNSDDVERLELSFIGELERAQPLIVKRQLSHVKAVHGDLHLNNICLFHGHPLPFDGIEFNDEYSNCDCIADLAFLLMDLRINGFRREASLVLNRYLERVDDYGGLGLLPLYLAYRAAVRAKVNCLAVSSLSSSEEREAMAVSAKKYFTFALKSLTEVRAPMLIAIGGLSGSGKSTLALELALHIDAIRVNSDTVRKHIFEIRLEEKAENSRYNAEATMRTYEGVGERAALALKAGQTVIVDATFLEPEHRLAIEEIAAKGQAQFVGIWCEAAEAIIVSRLGERKNSISDATVEVFRSQQKKKIGQLSWTKIDSSGDVVETARQVANSLSVWCH